MKTKIPAIKKPKTRRNGRKLAAALAAATAGITGGIAAACVNNLGQNACDCTSGWAYGYTGCQQPNTGACQMGHDCPLWA